MAKTWRARRGALNHRTGALAEETVARAYRSQGAVILETRWRCPAGEIDLIVGLSDEIVIVEVKRANTMDAAMHSLRPAQIARLAVAAQAYCGQLPLGLATPLRFDLAVVDRLGAVQISPGAIIPGDS